MMPHCLLFRFRMNRIVDIAKINLKAKLTYFYMECVLKELIDHRVRRQIRPRKYDAKELSFV